MRAAVTQRTFRSFSRRPGGFAIGRDLARLITRDAVRGCGAPQGQVNLTCENSRYQSKLVNHSPTVNTTTTATAMSANTLSVSDIAFSSMLPSTLTAVAAAPIT